MFETLLIANRGEIAVRIARTAKRLGLRVVAVYSDADRDALHVRVADEAWRIGPSPAAESYLRIDTILEAARRSEAGAIHPGYGFLSENPDFAAACETAGLVFVGPPAEAMRAMGRKDSAKALMARAGVRVVPGYGGEDQDVDRLAAEAERIGFPVLIKAVAGGGGKGMRRVDAPAQFAGALADARREARDAFGDDRVLLERCLTPARHIEMQVFADRQGNAVHLFERDCSLQRRHQKVIEEAPAPGMSAALRAAMGAAAVQAARAVGYRGAGTVEFIVEAAERLPEDRFFFVEMNTRLQVEHPVTEMITGLDLVEWQLRVASGEPLPLRQEDLAITGHAIEARIYAEDPARGFLPQTGRLARLSFPEHPGCRVDAGVRPGDAITPFYDPMIAKLIAHAADRAEALARLAQALRDSRVEGCGTNLGFLSALLGHPDVRDGHPDTGLIDRDLAALVAEGPASPLALAVAAAAAAGVLDPPSGGGPFAMLRNFRLWGEAERHVELEQGGATHHLDVSAGREGVTVALGTSRTAFAIVEAVDETLRVETGGRIVPVRLTRDDGVITVALADEVVRFVLPRSISAGHEAAEATAALHATMPGLVRAVHVRAGEEVRRGDALVVTEAMKMVQTTVAPRDAIIASVAVSVGDQVAEGTLLVTFEPERA